MKHEHTYRRAPDWDRPASLKAGYEAMECTPCCSVIWVQDPSRVSDPAGRMRDVLKTGKWPSGLDVAPYEREAIEANLERLEATS